MPKSRPIKVNLQRLLSLYLITFLVLLIVGLLSLQLSAQPPVPTRRVNAPHLEPDVTFSERAIFWFGQVETTTNYADVRVGYNDDKLSLHVAVFDQWLWYDKMPSPEDLTNWDAVSLYLNLDGNTGDVPATNTYRIVSQLYKSQANTEYQAVYRGDGSGWVTASIPITIWANWRGTGLNDSSKEARGWRSGFSIPFSSLGLSSPPLKGTIWGLGIALHDRDDEAGSPIPDQIWPETMDGLRPATWGQLVFGVPTYQRPLAKLGEVVTIRQGLNGASVVDGHVGGHTVCGQAFWPDQFFTGWGEANYAGYEQINIQNQHDVADWPCFSKYYVTFPLDTIPPGKAILSATLTMHKLGNAGQGPGKDPQPSLIQVLTVAEDWDETTLTWNNAPLAMENVAASWAYPVDSFPGWPGVPVAWDISGAVAAVYSSAGEPLRLALYEADHAQNSGKYFVSSDIGDWNDIGRPTLQVLWGDPLEVVEQVYLPLIFK